MKIEFLESAEPEFVEAVTYYNNGQSSLGDRHQQEIQKSLLRIANYPESYQSISTRSRRCIVAKFPYGIIYQYRQSEVCMLWSQAPNRAFKKTHNGKKHLPSTHCKARELYGVHPMRTWLGKIYEVTAIGGWEAVITIKN